MYKKKYLLICVSESRGLQQYTARLADALSKNVDDDYSISLCAQKSTIDLTSFSENNTVVLKPSKFSIINMFRLLKSVFQREVEVVHYQGINIFVLLALCLSRLLVKKKLVLTPHNVVTHFPNKIYNKFKWSIWARFDAIVLHTSSEASLVPRRLQSKLRTIPHGEYSDQAETSMPSSQFRKAVSELIPFFLFSGYIRDDKNLQLILDNYHSINDNGFNLVVAGQNKSEIKSDLIHKRTNKYFDSFLSDDELSYLLKNCEGVFLPYSKVSESGILHMALAYGTPVICSNLPSFLERINHMKNGYVLPSLSNLAVEKFLEDYDSRSFNRQEIQREHLENYSWNTIAIKTLKEVL